MQYTIFALDFRHRPLIFGSCTPTATQQTWQTQAVVRLVDSDGGNARSNTPYLPHVVQMHVTCTQCFK